MDTRTGAVRGDLIQWARTQQAVTMREIRERGGPCLGYQSEVEHLKKTEVHSDILTKWVSLLSVTEAFARGQVPRYFENPAACRGLAGDVALMVRSRRGEWFHMSALERARQVLRLIAFESAKLPRVVLAHVLHLELESLDAMLTGSMPMVHGVVEALQDLTTLPPAFFKYGEVEPESVTDLCEGLGLTPEQLKEYLPAIRRAADHGISGSELEQMV